MEPAGSQPVDASVLDLESYNLPGLREDIQQILDLPSAIGTALQRGLTLVVLGTAAVWLVFRPRMALWALVPYIALAFAALALAAAAISAFLVLRTRLDSADRAADRTLFTVAAMHGDLVNLQAAGVTVPKREVASFITQKIVFPILLGSAGSFLVDSATTATGPLGWFSNRLMKTALAEVEGRVLAALDVVDESDGASADATATPQDGVPTDSWADLPELELPEQIRGWYEEIHRYLSRVVDGIELLTVGGAGATTALATAPLIAVLVLGWLVSG